MSETRKLRCAVYTRKSSEEGLDQDFNSLDAQREACVAYIMSQASLGWRLVPEHYDDGGISGGTLERPGIQRLLQHIQEGRVDVVVVYKIDRLTRSLMDFAKLVEVFDKHSASFVSVTQQFNTTTSMGRLTLNVLLSFAQFEREVTAERIRDKVAASKKKGMWMGGVVPLGYRAEHKKLVIDEENAATVRRIFERYLGLRSVDALARELNRANPFKQVATRHSRGKLYHLLSNPIYIGKIRHQGQMHDGQHEAIIDRAIFEAVQQLLAQQAANPRGAAVQADTHLLTGLLYDEDGRRLTPVHAQNHGKRYRYYVTDTRPSGASGMNTFRIAATAIEPVVVARMMQLLRNRAQLARWIERFGTVGTLDQLLNRAAKVETRIATDKVGASSKALVRSIVRRIVITPDALRYEVDMSALVEILSKDISHLDEQDLLSAIGMSKQASDKHGAGDRSAVTIEQHIVLKRRGVETRIVVSDATSVPPSLDQSLVDVLARAHLALASLTDGSGLGIAEVARAMHMDASDLSRILPLAYLSPKVTEAILTGRQPADLTWRKLTRGIDLPIEWSRQNELLLG